MTGYRPDPAASKSNKKSVPERPFPPRDITGAGDANKPAHSSENYMLFGGGSSTSPVPGAAIPKRISGKNNRKK